MAKSTNKYEQWAQAKFQGLTKDELIEAGKIFGCEFDRAASESVMRTKLCEKIGEAPMQEPEVKVAPVKAGQKPNLTPQGVWGGRRQRVILSRGPLDMNHRNKAITWEGITRAFPYDEMVDMPLPWFNVMKDAVNAHITQKKVHDDDDNLIGMQKVETPYNVHQYRDLGPTPGTEDLPGDLCEFWQREGKRTKYFAGYSRSALIAIRGDFVGSVGMAFYKDLTTEEIRFDVLRKCNLESAVLELEAEAQEKHEAQAA